MESVGPLLVEGSLVKSVGTRLSAMLYFEE
jgi:hypothetical protein